MSNEEKVKNLQKAYELCEKVFCTGTGIMEVGDDFALQDNEKFEFFSIVFAYFARKKQKELIEKGVF